MELSRVTRACGGFEQGGFGNEYRGLNDQTRVLGFLIL